MRPLKKEREPEETAFPALAGELRTEPMAPGPGTVRTAAIRNSILKAEKIWTTSFAVYSEMHLQAADQAARQAADPVEHPAEVSGAAVFRTVAFRTVISAAAVPAAPEADSADMAAEASR